MLFLLSPSKALDYQTPVPAATRRKATDPLFVDQATQLINVMRTHTPAQVASLMDLSDSLAQLNVGRYAAWQPQATAANSKPAVLAFDGDVYDGLQATTLTQADLTWAQKHVVILSGLYGVLRPLDRLQPYRLEMGTAVATPRGGNLYDARAALRPALAARVVDCVFEDWKDGRYKVISFFAKRARGLMARWAIEQRVAVPSRLKQFQADGYAFDAAVSQPDRLVFRRRGA
jgi:cytoplasmic iron level regulating protein YaaA (DUF328/UPF0246 family)